MDLNPYLEVDGRRVDVDVDGYLLHSEDWSRAVAERLAESNGIALGEAHWEVIGMLRDFYRQHQIAPAMRPLVKLAARQLGADKGSSIYLLRLFPGNPALVASRIAGLPRPENCF